MVSAPTPNLPAPALSDALRVLDLVERLGRLVRGVRRRRVALDPVQWEALRYFSRANRYSRGPGALALYLAATKGTVSQTVRALERRGYLARERNARDRRSVSLTLTPRGRHLLDDDPLVGLIARSRDDRVGRLAAELEALLAALQRANGHRSFGVCATCDHFRRDVAPGLAGGPHRCGLTGEALSVIDATLICGEHEHRQQAPAGALITP
jgi:DNA-binding MarR family transcriptional regulator